MTWRRVIFILTIVYGAYHYFNQAPSDAVVVSDYQIHPLEPFEMHARVLSSKHYSSGREADLVPVDLVFGWGPMADLSISDQVSISQRNRWYYWRVKKFPIPKREIEKHSANMHLIPATPEIEAAIQAAEAGQMVEFSGDLVEVVSNDGRWRWKSSLTRNDTGAGACEVVLVKSFTLL